MKAMSHRPLIAALCLLLLNLCAATRALAQQNCSIQGVTVRAYPLGNGEDDLKNSLTDSTREVLNRINDKEGLDALLRPDVVSDADADLLRTACTLHTRYNILPVPTISNDADSAYVVRGLHLDVDGAEEYLQLALTFDSSGMITKMDVLDADDRRRAMDETRRRVSALPRGEEVLDLVLELENAYNTDADSLFKGADGMPNLSRLLGNAEIKVSILRNGQAVAVPPTPSFRYIQRLETLIRRVGSAPTVTYELVNVYPHRDNAGEYSESLYRVTLIQHWMFLPNGYIDTDYLSLDVELSNEPFFRFRNAGRGAFSVTSRPAGVQIVEFDHIDWTDLDRTTPFDEYINAPWQFHYLTLDNTWYETEFLSITSEQVLADETVSVDMTHRPGQIQLTVLPDAENTTLSLHDENTGFQATPFENGGIVEIPVDLLKGVPHPDSTIQSDFRQVRLQLVRAFYEPVDTTLQLPGPDPVPVTIELKRLQGTLEVTSSPSPSQVIVDADSSRMTPLEERMDVTGDGPLLQVSTRNDRCLSNGMETDCLYHIPSTTRGVQIVADQTTREHFELGPFVVRNLTETADLRLRLERTGEEEVDVAFELVDRDERNRKYAVDFELQDSASWEPVADLQEQLVCTGENACTGAGLRPGEYGFAWSMDRAQQSSMPGSVPVLTLRRKGVCWPCVLIPAAAGVAAAYIFPRTGSDDDGTFLPPPRPSDF